jgi:hypothetical protein
VPLRSRKITGALTAFAAGLASLLASGVARGEGKAACVEAHEHGQEVRLANRWVEARRMFLACAQPICPPLVVQDCTRWEDELSQRIPSVVVSAKRADGTDLDDVALFVDGARIGERLPIVPIPLDPGEHVLRFVHAGWGAVERRLILHDGEHDRRVEVMLEPPARPATDSGRSSGAPVAAYVATGVGAVAAITSVVFLVLGKVDEHDLAASPCGQAGNCTDGQVEPIRVDYIVSGITAGVAVVAVGIAAWQFLSGRSPSPRALAWTGRIEF